jgi:hypothetical protein
MITAISDQRSASLAVIFNRSALTLPESGGFQASIYLLPLRWFLRLAGRLLRE